MSLRYSFELFPPRTPASASRVDAAVDAFIALDPEFVSVTFGAGGSTSRHSLGVLQRLIDGGANPMAHLTCTGLSVAETSQLVRQFLDAGITRFLALRGDPPREDSPMPPTSLQTASQLVQLIQRVESEREPYAETRLPGLRAASLSDRRRTVDVAVAAFPNGHPGAGVHRRDIDALLAKQAAGATMAITQLFFDPYDYARFVELARARGVTIPIVPGVAIPTSHRRLVRSAELAGEGLPQVLADRLARAAPEDAVRIGVDAAVALISALAEHDPPSVHLYTFNDHRPAIDVLEGVGALPIATSISTGAP
ncbi:methylenetetrahydrofolate reductase (NADPH) [Agrococcus baldri]|uniref:Methylenetetrahydrofolate reductase n=1 Tax=Agrococcus baldri TaxID=153730 RepID=A0AA94L0Q9_9MICO|nr:methylenetetrahydrofolate reductase [Agrococcus baldri]SFS18032.1 methylenetetrahydrofolate reductase (NADPH) [Agrococcus baldri]